MPTGLFRRWDFDSATSSFTPRQNKTPALKIRSCPRFNAQNQNVKLKAYLQPAERKKMTGLVFISFVLIATLCLKSWVASTTSVPVKMYVLLSLNRFFNVVAGRESSIY